MTLILVAEEGYSEERTTSGCHEAFAELAMMILEDHAHGYEDHDKYDDHDHQMTLIIIFFDCWPK